MKGQKARSGVAINGFEGGQMPLHMRMPKRGFNNAVRARAGTTVSPRPHPGAIEAGKLDAKATVDADALIAAGVIRRAKDGVRLLGNGEFKAKVTFNVAYATKAALERSKRPAAGQAAGSRRGSELKPDQ